MECKSPRNPFKQQKKSCDELAAHQLKLFMLIPGVGEKKARTLLEHFGHPQGLASVTEDMLVAKLTPLIGESSAQNVYDFFYTKIRFTRT
jgi:ERCC4-type nuclease